MTNNKVSHYNDRCRQALIVPGESNKLIDEGCILKIVMTQGFKAFIEENDEIEVLRAIAAFDDFAEENDPYGEHDFIFCTYQGQKLFAKFDYYDRSLEYGSPDPSDLSITCRVLTLMMPEEY